MEVKIEVLPYDKAVKQYAWESSFAFPAPTPEPVVCLGCQHEGQLTMCPTCGH